MARPVLADTDALIDLVGQVGVEAEVARLISAGRLKMTSVVFYELWRGAEDEEERAGLRQALAGVPVVWLTRHDAEAAAKVWRELTEHQRSQVGDRDILIAGTAIARGWPVLTRNRRHFALTGAELHVEG
jgi:tRNA(fMet)-specific endonuclease VapC